MNKLNINVEGLPKMLILERAIDKCAHFQKRRIENGSGSPVVIKVVVLMEKLLRIQKSSSYLWRFPFRGW